MKNAFFQEFLLKHDFLRACYLAADWPDRIVLIKRRNSYYDWNGLAAQFWQIESALETVNCIQHLENQIPSARTAPATTSYPDVCLAMKICAQRKAGRRKRARFSASHCLLRFATSHSRFALALPGGGWLRHDVRCVWKTCFSPVALLFTVYLITFWGILWT